MKLSILPFILAVSLIACNNAPTPESRPAETNKTQSRTFPERAKDMTIYEVNIRQHTAEGTFKAFEQDLPRLKELGADMLWIMPVQPIGKKNRKGSLGSYYSISDYKSANPEFGTLDEFKSMVKAAHNLGLVVILDWVPNHTAWDHTWIAEHPEYYMTDSAATFVAQRLGEKKDYYKKSGTGELVYEADWNDIALLNLHHAGTRAAMIDAMRFWIEETDIDGFRTDHAGHEIPLYFWEEATTELNPIKDLFWLAEWDEPRMHIVYHATYDWGLLHLTEAVAKGEKSAEDIHVHILNDMARYGNRPFRLNMINNHDENAWAGTVKERYGEGERAFAVFSFLAYGTPVLYSGQEIGLDKRLKFFEKDPIIWDDPQNFTAFYRKLNELKAENPALYNGEYGGVCEKIEDDNEHVFSFRRVKESNNVIGFINMSDKQQTVRVDPGLSSAQLTDTFTGKQISAASLSLAPWEYVVHVGN